MTSLSSSLLSVGILLSSMFVTLGVMFVLLKQRDSTVKLPVDRDQLQPIPAFGLLPLYFKDGRLCFSSWNCFSLTEQITRQAILATQPFSQWLAIVRAVTNKEPTSQIKAPFSLFCSRELKNKQLVKTIPAVRTQILSQQQVDAIVYQVAQRCLSKSEVRK
ncbi:hypothetical protein [Shewanella psychromarinicola]|uniref:Uncharacterized protein n=1 Tax=Shewanella psychromarinicola TaxID=2487742 RepID=A0A3N4DPS7_9GAMM|nr:hypothetical protein [Shewanella psychromarinicola]AZG33576.1 hypothetical protein EGC80_00620 [Shewanella psychromarinicola]MCL1082459.1 hypothetical protein [Shewanella psychromarinicola]RPA23630.1 hypothetical protein EGC77_18055 [Shewanella psychromarinicola]